MKGKNVVQVPGQPGPGQGIPNLGSISQAVVAGGLDIGKVDNGFQMAFHKSNSPAPKILVFNDAEEAELKALALVKELFKAINQ